MSAWSAIWRITAFLIVWGILLAPCLLIAQGQEKPQSVDSRLGHLALEGCATGTIVIAACVMRRFVDRMPVGSLGLGGRNILSLFSAGVSLGGAMMAAAALALWLIGVANANASWDVPVAGLALAGGAVLLNSITQEVLVQGYVLQTLERRSGPVWAVCLSATLFTVLHGPAIGTVGVPALNILLAGLLLGTAYVLSRSLWLPIGIHFGWNVVQGPVLGLAVSGRDLGAGSPALVVKGPQILTGGAFGPEGGVIATAVTLSGIAAVFVAWRKRPGKGDDVLISESRTTKR